MEKKKEEDERKKKNHRQMTAVGVSSFLNLVINAAFVLKRRRFITTWLYVCMYTILATAARPPLGLKTR